MSAEQMLAGVEDETMRDREVDAPALADHSPAERYPEQHMPIAGVDGFAGTDPAQDDDVLAALRGRYERFCAVREDALLDYNYNTARAYWGDLEDLFLWCEHRGFDISELTDAQFRQYVGLLRRRKYSENTIRRRGVALRRFRRFIVACP